MNATNGVYNLTALADRLRPAAKVLPVLEHEVLAAAILRPEQDEFFEDGPAPHDTVYVVIAGYGSLGSSDADDVEVTAGDVLFVPLGQQRRFRNLSGKFEVWRLVLHPSPT
jgi:mannose-6-phosphate isomerase-like protein (cupin superfamily)